MHPSIYPSIYASICLSIYLGATVLISFADVLNGCGDCRFRWESKENGRETLTPRRNLGVPHYQMGVTKEQLGDALEHGAIERMAEKWAQVDQQSHPLTL